MVAEVIQVMHGVERIAYRGGKWRAAGAEYEGTAERVRGDGAGSTVRNGTGGLSTDTRVGSRIAIVIGSWSRIPGAVASAPCDVLLLASAAYTIGSEADFRLRF